MTRAMLFVFCCFLLTQFAACGEQAQNSPEQAVATLSGPAVKRSFDPQRLALGQKTFSAHCARCHGQKAEGAANWRIRKNDGTFPPPPLDGSGHAWHHEKLRLKHQIRFGSEKGQGDMPPFKDKLSEQEIEAVIVWFQSLWPAEIYSAWYDMHGSGQ